MYFAIVTFFHILYVLFFINVYMVLILSYCMFMYGYPDVRFFRAFSSL